MSVIVQLKRVVRLLNRRERRRLLWLVTLTPIAALGEMGAVAAMLPFLSAVVDPASLRSSPLGTFALEALGLQHDNSLVLLLGAAAFVVLMLTNTLIVGALWMLLRFSWSLHHRLSTALLAKYLNEPYAFFLSQNSAGLTGNLVMQVEAVTDGYIVPALTAFSRGCAAVALILFLAVTEPLLALAALGLIGGIYSVFYFGLARRKLDAIGARRHRINAARVQVINEAFGGIKDVKLLHAEAAFADAFRPLSQAFARDRVLSILIGTAPRYIVESVAFGGIVLVTLAIAAGGGRDGRVLPLLGMFAFAGYRLMPTIQNIFAALVFVRTHRSAFDSLYADLSEHDPERDEPRAAASSAAVPSSELETESRSEGHQVPWPRRSIDLQKVMFRYPTALGPALDNLSLSVKAKTTTGIVGPTGSGKTTFVDLLLGLLRPSQGELSIDGVNIDAQNLDRWQSTIGYVPQHIYLSDASVAHNVAFGVPEQQIDMDRVHEACQVARIHDFVMHKLPNGYRTEVGERGIRLSGGERQRIGIARALYRRPEVLVLDEATSALDRTTEEEVMVSIRALAGKKTIIMIAHRESTLRDCDVIYRIARGRLELVGNYADLVGETAPLQEAAV